MPYMDFLRTTFRPYFDGSTNEWVLQVPGDQVRSIDGSYEIRLPLVLAKETAPGGAFIRNERKKYRAWLLQQQKNQCAVCQSGPDENKGGWVLDHQPPLGEPGSKFIDYEVVSHNKVVHRQCHTRRSG